MSPYGVIYIFHSTILLASLEKEWATGMMGRLYTFYCLLLGNVFTLSLLEESLPTSFSPTHSSSPFFCFNSNSATVRSNTNLLCGDGMALSKEKGFIKRLALGENTYMMFPRYSTKYGRHSKFVTMLVTNLANRMLAFLL